MADNVAVTAGVGTTIAADEVGSAYYQRMKRSVGADGSATDYLDKHSRSDTYTTAANGTAVDVSAQGFSAFAIGVKGTGAAATAWNVVIEGSIDGTNYSTIATHVNTVHTDGQVLWVGANRPCLYFRSRCVSVTLGSATNIVATILGLDDGGDGNDVSVGGTLRSPTGIAAGSHVAQTVAIVDSAGDQFDVVPVGADVSGTNTALTADTLGSHTALAVQIVDASGVQITTFGGSAGTITTHHLIVQDDTNTTSVKASAGVLRAVKGFNNGQVPIYIKFHNTAGTPTAGSGVVYVLGAQAGLPFDYTLAGGGRSFATGIGMTVVTSITDAGVDTPALDCAVVEVEFE